MWTLPDAPVPDAFLSGALADILADDMRSLAIPGCVAALWHHGRVGRAAFGWADPERRVPVGPDTVFPLYSIAKLFTATMIIEAVAAGWLDLDAAVTSLLPDFGPRDPRGGDIRVRHLLAHVSGLPGDLLLDTGNGDDCITTYVRACAELDLFHRPGEIVSYCNAGFVLLGAILERLHGQPFDRILTRRLLDPLRIGDQPAGAARAVTHVMDPVRGRPVPLAGPAYGRALGPAGADLALTAEELLRFGLLHLGHVQTGGDLPWPVLKQMRLPQSALPDGLAARGFGLGWMLPRLGAPGAVGHDGASMTFLRLFPEADAALVLLTNGGQAATLASRVIPRVMDELLGLPAPPVPAVTAGPAATDGAYIGRYRNMGMVVDVARRDDGLSMRLLTVPGATSDRPDAGWRRMLALGGQGFALDDPAGDRLQFTFSGGAVRWMHMGVRALKPDAAPDP